MQVSLGNVETVEICVDDVPDATYQHFYHNDSVLSCAQNAARSPWRRRIECPDQNASGRGAAMFSLRCVIGALRAQTDRSARSARTCRYCTRQEFYDIATEECVVLAAPPAERRLAVSLPAVCWGIRRRLCPGVGISGMRK